VIVRPAVGDPAPDGFLLDTSGHAMLLSTLWRDRPAVLVFLRYFGCPFCQMHVVALRADEDRFREVGANVVLIGQGPPGEGERFCAEKRVSFACALDPDGSAFGAYGLGRGSLLQVFGPKVLGPFLAANAHGETRQRGMAGGSMMQMPGAFVVDTEGMVRLAHRNRTINDSPRNGLILGVLADLGGARADSHRIGTDLPAGTPTTVEPRGELRPAAPGAT
jgi:peroxiredoxin